MKRNPILPIIACGASLALCTGLQAQEATPAASVSTSEASPGGHQWGRGGGQLARLTAVLNLTPDQQTQIKPILETFRSTAQSVRQDTTLAPADKMAKVKAARETETSAINAILTPDQQAKYAAFQAKMHNHRHGEAEAAASPSTSP